MDKAKRDLALRSFIASSMGFFAFLLFAIILLSLEVVWLLVLSVLLAFVLRIPTDWIRQRFGLGNAVAYSIVLVCVFVIGTLVVVLVAPQLAQQGRELSEAIPHSPVAMREFLGRYEWGRTVARNVPDLYERITSRVMEVAADKDIWLLSIRLLGAGVFVMFVAVYLAASPLLYTEGFVRLLPIQQRRQGRVLLMKIGRTLKWWMVGRLVSMVSVGSLTTILLLYLEIPLALVLGLLATLFTFVPYLGPLVSAFPILIITLIEAPEFVLLVLVAYTAIQLLEGYLLTPLVQRITVYLPPAMTLVAEVVMGLLFGTLGIIVATPVAAIVLVLVIDLYVRGWIEGKGLEDSLLD
jgi:predicted PurR-regulated permease PerM